MIKNKLIFGLVLLFSLSTLCFADSEESLLIKGLQAYKDKDWTTSLFFLRKAATLPVNNNAETWYVLIMAEVYASDFEGAEREVVSEADVDVMEDLDEEENA